MPASAPPRAPARPPLAPAFPEPRGAAPLALPSLTSDPAAASLPTSPRSVPVPLIRPRPETAPHLAPEARSFPPVTLGGGAPTSVRRTGKRGAIGAAVALLAALAASVAVFTGADETGALVVTVSGPGSASVEGVEVIADDVARCETAPCRIQDLPAGTHFVKVSAKGYAPTAARAVAVQSGGDTTIHIELSRPPSEPVATTSERSEPPAAKPRRPAEAQTLAVADLAAQDVDTAAPAARAAPASRRNGAGRTTPPAAPKPAVAATGTLNIDSNPAASVVVDGRPVGRTPLVGLSVSAGPHTVTFIHPEKGRTTKAAVVEPGKPATISARF